MYVDFIVKLINEYCLFFTTSSLLPSLSRISSSSPETKLSVSARTPSRIMYFLSRRFHPSPSCSRARTLGPAPMHRGIAYARSGYATRAYGTSLFALQIRDVLETRWTSAFSFSLSLSFFPSFFLPFLFFSSFFFFFLLPRFIGHLIKHWNC